MIKPIRKKVSEQKDLRNIAIKSMYKALMSIDGSQRTAVAEHVSQKMTEIYGKVSYSTVMRVTANE